MSGRGVAAGVNAATRGYAFADQEMDEDAARAEEQRRYATQEARAAEQHGALMDEAAYKQGQRTLQEAVIRTQTGIPLTEQQADILLEQGIGPGMAEQTDRELAFLEDAVTSGNLGKGRTPEGLEALNNRLKRDINSDRTGTPLPGERRISDIVPGKQKGTVVAVLDGVDENGKRFKGEGMTEKRSADKKGDPNILQTPVENIIDRLGAQRYWVEMYRRDPDFKKQLDAYAQAKDWSTATAQDWKVDAEAGLMWDAKSGTTRKLDPDTLKQLRAAGGKDISVVQLTSGKRVKESDVKAMYLNEYGKPNDMGMMAIGPEAPSYIEWRNSIVAPDYRLNDSAQPAAIGRDEARTMAEKEAQDKAGYLTTDKEDFGPDGREKWINDRTQEILRQAQGASGTGQGQGVNQGGQGATDTAGSGKLKPTYTAPNGITITQADIETTAKKKGLTPEQVIQQYNLK